MSKQIIQSEFAPAAIGTYSQAVSHNGLLWLSGQIPLDPRNGQLVEGDFAAQLKQVLDSLQAVCRAAGTDLSRAVKLNVYLTDLGHFATVNRIMSEYLQAPYPARAAVQVAALPRGAQVEIDGVVALGD
ncbi:MAG: RidA family protein [Pseudomonadota bacterium]|uniref:RidA family protein n=1 Tax=Thermithiobacillus tepidarius TaxID=929 RepID=UPI0003FFF67B|nr:RidA family protein [Thermithiobacillus tepidarius]